MIFTPKNSFEEYEILVRLRMAQMYVIYSYEQLVAIVNQHILP